MIKARHRFLTGLSNECKYDGYLHDDVWYVMVYILKYFMHYRFTADCKSGIVLQTLRPGHNLS